ncbi:MAG TPA: hypothetical protein PK476_03065 [Candidatus Pacearchaeota archaeon]|nr:hypothetical protein [Candidatus Pacearchaeota archaeon]HQM24855.1 hypothetical protein [Candidatus Pacearchaeota archaeon]
MDQENTKIEELIEIAFKEGIEKAIKIVKELEDPYLLDEFHDRLLEEIKKR